MALRLTFRLALRVPATPPVGWKRTVSVTVHAAALVVAVAETLLLVHEPDCVFDWTTKSAALVPENENE